MALTKTELEAKIAKLKKSLANSASMPATIKQKMNDSLKKYEDELKALEKTAPAKKAEPQAAAKKKTTAPVKEEKSGSKKTVTIGGKEYDKDDAELCKKVVAAFYTRREAAKQSKAKSDSKSPAAKAAGQIGDAVSNIIESTSTATAKNKPAEAGSDIVEKILKLMERELAKRAKDDPKKKEAVQKAIALIKQLLKDL